MSPVEHTNHFALHVMPYIIWTGVFVQIFLSSTKEWKGRPTRVFLYTMWYSWGTVGMMWVWTWLWNLP